MKIECPVCEDRFESPDSTGTVVDNRAQIKCPTCGRTFARSEFNSVSDFVPTAEVVEPPDTPATPPLPPGVAQSQKSATSQLNPKSSSVVKHRRARKKAQPWILAFATLLVAVAFAGLAYFLLATDVLAPWPDPESENQTDLVNAIEEAKQNSEAPVAKAPAKKTKKAPTVDQIQKPDARIISDTKLKRTWTSARPYIVKLTAQTPVGPKLVTGTIVDSRGWIATSYRAIEGATEISVSQSAKDFLKSGDSGLTKDDVRGVIATDVENDIAILSINRQLIMSLTDLPLLEKDNLLGSMYLIQCVPPTAKFPWATTECRIDRRRRLADFSEEQKTALKGDEISNPETKWIVHNNISPASAGSPLLNETGELAGITISSKRMSKVSPDTAIAAPIDLVKTLLQSATDQPTSLPLPIVGGSTNAPATSGMAVLPATSDLNAASVALNKAGADCDTSDWSTENVDDAGKLVAFAERLLDAQQFVADDKTSDSDKTTLQEQIDFWTKRFKTEILAAIDRNDDEKLAAFNKAAARQLGFSAEAVFIAFTNVKLAAIQSPRMTFESDEEQDTVTLEVVGTDKNVITLVDKDWPVLRPGSDWLVIGRGTGQQSIIRTSSEAIRTESGTISFLFDASR